MNPLPLAAGLLICGPALAQNAPAPGAPEQQQQEQQQQEQSAELPRPSVEVTEAGAEPRKELRYRPTVGQAERVELALSISLVTVMEGQEQPPMALPTITTIWRQTPREVAGGRIAYDIACEQVEVDQTDEIAAQLQQLFAPLTQVRGAGEMTDRGEPIRLDLSGPAEAHPVATSQIDQMRTHMRNLGVIFPQESIGEGAAWVVTMPVEIDGVQVEQKTTYTLRSSEQDTVRLTMAVDQSAEQQKLSPPGLPPESATVEKFTGTGEGEMTLDTDRLAPSRSSSSSSITVDLSIDVGGQVQEVTQRMESRVQATSNEAGEDPEKEGQEPEKPEPAGADGG